MKSYKPEAKVQASINWGAIATVMVGVFAVAFPDLYGRFPPMLEGAIVGAVSSIAAYMKAN